MPLFFHMRLLNCVSSMGLAAGRIPIANFQER
jgi:hypothetical protein